MSEQHSELPDTQHTQTVQTSEQKLIPGVPTRKLYKHLHKHGKRTHTIPEPFEQRREKYLEMRELRQQIRQLKAERLEEVTQLVN